MLIGVTGKAGVGKSTTAQVLVRDHGFVCVPFAGPLKKMLSALGLSDAELYGDMKEVVNQFFGQTPRHMMQTLGTDWGREMIHPAIWLKAWELEASKHEKVIVDDVRFMNEVDLIKSLNGMVIRLDRNIAHNPETAKHASESLMEGHDWVVSSTSCSPEEVAQTLLESYSPIAPCRSAIGRDPIKHHHHPTGY